MNAIAKMKAACLQIERELKAEAEPQTKDDLFYSYFIGVLPAFAEAVGIRRARSYAATISLVRIEKL